MLNIKKECIKFNSVPLKNRIMKIITRITDSKPGSLIGLLICVMIMTAPTEVLSQGPIVIKTSLGSTIKLPAISDLTDDVTALRSAGQTTKMAISELIMKSKQRIKPGKDLQARYSKLNEDVNKYMNSFNAHNASLAAYNPQLASYDEEQARYDSAANIYEAEVKAFNMSNSQDNNTYQRLLITKTRLDNWLKELDTRKEKLDKEFRKIEAQKTHLVNEHNRLISFDEKLLEALKAELKKRNVQLESTFQDLNRIKAYAESINLSLRKHNLPLLDLDLLNEQVEKIKYLKN